MAFFLKKVLHGFVYLFIIKAIKINLGRCYV